MKNVPSIHVCIDDPSRARVDDAIQSGHAHVLDRAYDLGTETRGAAVAVLARELGETPRTCYDETCDVLPIAPHLISVDRALAWAAEHVAATGDVWAVVAYGGWYLTRRLDAVSDIGRRYGFSVDDVVAIVGPLS